MLKNVKKHGDKALYDYMKKFDYVDIEKIGLSVTEDEFSRAEASVSEEFKNAVKKACDNLFRFHRKQLPVGFCENYEDGVVLESRDCIRNASLSCLIRRRGIAQISLKNLFQQHPGFIFKIFF